jgi:hypothetical protein
MNDIETLTKRLDNLSNFVTALETSMYSNLNIIQKDVDQHSEILQSHSNEKVYSVPQAAVKLGLTAQGVNYHIRSGTLKASGKRNKKITETALNNYILFHKKA